MSKETFFVIYDGPLLENNEFEVRELAPAILAINDLIEEANKIIFGDKNKISLCVKANFKAGSFGMELVTQVHSLVTYLFDAKHVAYASNLLNIVGFIGATGSFSFLGLLKTLKNREIEKATKDDTKENTYHLHLKDSDEIIQTSFEALELYRSMKIRRSTEQMLKPLSKDGIDSFASAQYYKKKSTITFEILQEEIRYFRAPRQAK